MGHMGWWRPFGLEAELEMADDPVDGCGIFRELKTFIKKIEVSESFKKLVVSFILTIHGCKLLFYKTDLESCFNIYVQLLTLLSPATD